MKYGPHTAMHFNFLTERWSMSEASDFTAYNQYFDML